MRFRSEHSRKGLKYGKSVTSDPGQMPLPDQPCSRRQPSKSGKLVVGGIFGGLGLHPRYGGDCGDQDGAAERDFLLAVAAATECA